VVSFDDGAKWRQHVWRHSGWTNAHLELVSYLIQHFVLSVSIINVRLHSTGSGCSTTSSSSTMTTSTSTAYTATMTTSSSSSTCTATQNINNKRQWYIIKNCGDQRQRDEVLTADIQGSAGRARYRHRFKSFRLVRCDYSFSRLFDFFFLMMLFSTGGNSSPAGIPPGIPAYSNSASGSFASLPIISVTLISAVSTTLSKHWQYV
jgi:hypothetical protein